MREFHPRQLGATPAEFIDSIPGGNALLGYLKAEVKGAALSAVKPYVLGAYVVGGVATLLSIVAIGISAARR